MYIARTPTHLPSIAARIYFLSGKHRSSETPFAKFWHFDAIDVRQERNTKREEENEFEIRFWRVSPCAYYFARVSFMFKNSEKRCQFNDPVVGWSNPLNTIIFEKSILRNGVQVSLHWWYFALGICTSFQSKQHRWIEFSPPYVFKKKHRVYLSRVSFIIQNIYY